MASQMPSAGSGGPTDKLDTVLLWFRRDLRVADNAALHAAMAAGRTVIPVYIWSPEEEGQFQPGRCSRWWLGGSLRALEADIAALGARMVYRRAAESRQAMVQLVQETGAKALFFNHLYDPISLVRDNEVKAAMAMMGIQCQSFNSDMLYEPWEVLTEEGMPFTNFEGYWTKAMSMPYQPQVPLPVPVHMAPVPANVVGLDLKTLGLMTLEEELSNQQLDYMWKPGGKGAHKVLEKFILNRLKPFGHDRAKTDRESTSRLSPHIHYGEISVRHIYYVVRQRELEWTASGEQSTSCSDFLQQMGYREYARYLSFHFPFTHERSLLEHLRACPWKFDQRLFKAWRQGRTGYPLVDAGMRELWSSGWLHNRCRVVCASFLVKNLLLPWQWGLKHYWDALLDADLECDALGWQYCSGCLSDAHPFSYMIDHKTEAMRFDPDGNYVRRWLPVLARLPAKWIHRPWEAPEAVLADAGVELGVNYPWPCISLEESEAQVVHACAVIEQSLAWGHAPPQAPFRPASNNPSLVPASGSKGTPTPSVQGLQRKVSGSTHTKQEVGATGYHAGGARPAARGGWGEAEQRISEGGGEGGVPSQPGTPSGNEQAMEDSDEEVVSNTINNSQAIYGTMRQARAGAQGGAQAQAAQGPGGGSRAGPMPAASGLTAVVPSMSSGGSAPRVPAGMAIKPKGMPMPTRTVDTTNESVCAPERKRHRPDSQ